VWSTCFEQCLPHRERGRPCVRTIRPSLTSVVNKEEWRKMTPAKLLMTMIRKAKDPPLLQLPRSPTTSSQTTNVVRTRSPRGIRKRHASSPVSPSSLPSSSSSSSSAALAAASLSWVYYQLILIMVGADKRYRWDAVRNTIRVMDILAQLQVHIQHANSLS
jgi:hypothetical protein